tara:strand:- start:404 stop:628 length:225 start_codon:yes stop_codon:yes gene_type:complete
MRLNNIGSNITEVVINNTTILFSYSTPVAGWDDEGAFRTAEHYSPTTTKHINKYLGGKDVGRVVTQSYIDRVVI